jgi:hypothetical protein
MTTHDEQTDNTSSPATDVESTTPREPSSTDAEPSAAQPDPPTTADTPSQDTVEPGEPVTHDELSDTRNGSSTPEADEPLFADGTLSGLRSRWDDVQAAFVDDPKECVQKADALVAQVVDQLTSGFSEARARLEDQWARGENASTEDLRVALTRYREFFQRLLSA